MPNNSGIRPGISSSEEKETERRFFSGSQPTTLSDRDNNLPSTVESNVLLLKPMSIDHRVFHNEMKSGFFTPLPSLSSLFPSDNNNSIQYKREALISNNNNNNNNHYYNMQQLTTVVEERKNNNEASCVLNANFRMNHISTQCSSLMREHTNYSPLELSSISKDVHTPRQQTCINISDREYQMKRLEDASNRGTQMPEEDLQTVTIYPDGLHLRILNPSTSESVGQYVNNQERDDIRRNIHISQQQGNASHIITTTLYQQVLRPISLSEQKQRQQIRIEQQEGKERLLQHQQQQISNDRKSNATAFINDGPWTEEEKERFLQGLRECGHGAWRTIAEKYVKTRTRVQVASYAHQHRKRK
jgi:SHAQKYF class myb-like DNA-binding protein